jgi:hypothetical protein
VGRAAYLPHPVRRNGRALRPGLNRSRAATASEGGSIARIPRSVVNDLPPGAVGQAAEPAGMGGGLWRALGRGPARRRWAEPGNPLPSRGQPRPVEQGAPTHTAAPHTSLFSPSDEQRPARRRAHKFLRHTVLDGLLGWC